MTVREVGLPGGVGEELAAVGAALERFLSRPRGERPGEVVRDEMVGWRRLVARMELEFSGMVTELAACGEDEWLGYNSPTDWVKEECHLTGTAAWNALVVGEQAGRMPESTRALVDGEIGYAHLAPLARTAGSITSSETSSRFEEAPLLAKAHRAGRRGISGLIAAVLGSREVGGRQHRRLSSRARPPAGNRLPNPSRGPKHPTWVVPACPGSHRCHRCRPPDGGG